MMKTNLMIVLAGLLASAPTLASEWTDTVTLKGDLRYRHELIDQDGQEIRNRQRLRARLSLIAEPEEHLQLGFRLVSGSDDPVSTNQTLDGAFSTKDIRLDRAFFAWNHIDSGTRLSGGKMANPFLQPAKTELIWDGDLSPEGLALRHVFGAGNTKVMVNGAGLWLDERSSDVNAGLYGVQGALVHRMDGLQVTIGGSYFDYSNLQGSLVDGEFFGNTNDADAFLADFSLVEFFAEFGFEVIDRPALIFVDFVTNQQAETDHQGYLVGAVLGRVEKSGSWQVHYNYREIQKDAVVGALTDSDFRGGGTDGKGHEIGFGCQLSGQSTLAMSAFINDLGLENSVSYTRLQADLIFKF